MSNQKPHSVNETTHNKDSKKITMNINNKGICDACNYSEQKLKEIDWKQREKDLMKLLEKYKKSDGSYDCIVSGSGGKDSVKVAHLLKYKYGMNPLTVTWAPHMYTEIGRKNLDNWINIGGFDNLLFTANGKVMRKLTYEAFKTYISRFNHLSLE